MSVSKPLEVFLPSFLAGIMILLGSVFRALLWISNKPLWGILSPPNLGDLIWYYGFLIIDSWFFILLTTSIIVGVTISYVALILYNKPGQIKTWGKLILILSICSVAIPGGFFVGSILGITGGLLAITWRDKRINI